MADEMRTPDGVPVPEKFAPEKYCCSTCAQNRRCHVCKEQTETACSDCRIDLGVTVYVCGKKACRDYHATKCGQNLRERIAVMTDRKDAMKGTEHE